VELPFHIFLLGSKNLLTYAKYLLAILIENMIFYQRLISIVLASCFAIISWLSLTSNVIAIGGQPPLLNQAAPEFTLPTNTGDGSISLSDFRGKWVVLYFYPKDFTSGCTIEAQHFQQDLPKYINKNTQVIGISTDSVDSHAEFCDSEGLKFPLLADTKGEASRAYGSWIGFISVRHSFIIDPHGILRKTFVKVNPIMHSQEVLANLDELQAVWE
jgi:peroxiredoxin Q/BCP